MVDNDYRICKNCIMDTSDKDIEFDNEGICNHCQNYYRNVKKKDLNLEEKEKKLSEIINIIKKDGKKNKYDCIVGISGGADSTYTLYLAKNRGLKPLAVNLDNGWASRIAVKNISRTIKKLDIDLYTYVIDWEEFKDLQLAFLNASVIDMEILTDHAIKGALYNAAYKNKVKYILTGTSSETEGIMGKNWSHSKSDYLNIIDIHKKYGKRRLKTFPFLPLYKRIHFQGIKNIRMIELLNYIDYNLINAKNIIKKELGWEDYGRKHGESLFTRFYQEYILPRKFNVDKRRAHLSALICAKQITREDALKEIQRPLYNDQELKKDKDYILKKWDMKEKQFEEIMKLPSVSHYYFRSIDKRLRIAKSIYWNFIKKIKGEDF